MSKGMIQIKILFGMAVLGMTTAGLSVAGNESPGFSPAGKVVEGLHLESELLGRKVNYAIYLPPGYDDSARRYPVVYLLHGFTDAEWAWVQFGEVQVSADQGILSGEIPPTIIAMPDGGVTWYVNDASGSVPYEKMFIEEFIPHIDRTFRTRPSKEFRGVSGLSMGGFGSLMLAMRHPDLFAACVAFSSGIITDQEVIDMPQERWDTVFGAPFGKGIVGQNRISDHWKEYNPLYLAKNRPVDELKSVRYYIDCGDDDFLYKGNAALHILLRELEIPHEYRVREGGHEWSYWRTGIRKGLRFIGEGFHR